MLGILKLFTYVNDSGVNFHIILRFTLIVRDCRQPAGKLVAEVVDTGEKFTTGVTDAGGNFAVVKNKHWLSTMTNNSSLPHLTLNTR
jgi:hypothetical protein